MDANKRWRIEFETGDSITTEDEGLADLHRSRGRLVTELPVADREHLNEHAARE